MLFIVPLFILAFIALISLFHIIPSDSIRSKPANFERDHEAWTTEMEKKFNEVPVASEKYTEYAILEGLKSTPELQRAMQKRREQYMLLIGQTTSANNDLIFVDSSLDMISWPWDEFKADICRVADAANEISVDGKVTADVSGLVQVVYSPEEILRRIREILKQAKARLDRILQDETSSVEQVLQSIRHFVDVQLKLLPEEVRLAVEKFNEFRHDHPYVVVAASIVIVIVGTEVIVPWLFLELLEMFGFAASGPVAGSWAAAIQSVIYGGRTRGLFSILQHITMSAKRFWPARVFLDLAAIGAGAIVIWTSEVIRDTVGMWYSEMNGMIPDLNLLVQEDGFAVMEFEHFMEEVGRRCQGANIPEVQWLDVAIQFIVERVQDMAHGYL